MIFLSELPGRDSQNAITNSRTIETKARCEGGLTHSVDFVLSCLRDGIRVDVLSIVPEPEKPGDGNDDDQEHAEWIGDPFDGVREIGNRWIRFHSKRTGSNGQHHRTNTDSQIDDKVGN